MLLLLHFENESWILKKNAFYIHKGSLASGPSRERNWTWMKTSCSWGFSRSWKMCCFYWKDFYLITSRVCSVSTKTQVTLFVSERILCFNCSLENDSKYKGMKSFLLLMKESSSGLQSKVNSPRFKALLVPFLPLEREMGSISASLVLRGLPGWIRSELVRVWSPVMETCGGVKEPSCEVSLARPPFDKSTLVNKILPNRIDRAANWKYNYGFILTNGAISK